MPKRTSLKDRNRTAIAADPVAEAIEAAGSAEAVLEPPAAASPPEGDEEPRPAPRGRRTTKATTAPVSSRQKGAQHATATETARLGMYLTPEQFAGAKAAYLADWQRGGTADTFARWVAGAIDAHAARSAKQRAAEAEPRGRAKTKTGGTRSFTIPTETVARMREAINADHAAGRWPSDSAWCAEAIERATEAARAANGGSLPTPPPRLPNRLVR